MNTYKPDAALTVYRGTPVTFLKTVNSTPTYYGQMHHNVSVYYIRNMIIILLNCFAITT